MEIDILNSFFAVRYWKRQFEMKFQSDILIQIPTDLSLFITIKNETVTGDSPCKKREMEHTSISSFRASPASVDEI